ncbi:MAG: winged helix-turn-helix domain-containing protein, partial [Spirochaetales bacterium]|nr:winged helix-turn-helix domain-containing protein [Spirochaetales bacterium]
MSDRPLNRATLSSQVTTRLEDMIRGGEYPVASVLPSIQKLCELFGVSRTVVREALRDLAARGLIRIVNGRGAVATEFHMAVARIASNEFLILLIDSIRVALDGAEETSPRTVDRRIVHRAQSLHER